MTAGGSAIGRGCVTGRFQPVHEDHLRLIRIALAECARVVVGITSPDPAKLRPEPTSAHRHRLDANPFTYLERLALIVTALGDDRRVIVAPFDLGEPDTWVHQAPLDTVQYVALNGPWEAEKAQRLRTFGYAVREVEPAGPEPRRATDIREAMRAGEPWDHLVPEATVPLLHRMIARREEDGRPL